MELLNDSKTIEKKDKKLYPNQKLETKEKFLNNTNLSNSKEEKEEKNSKKIPSKLDKKKFEISKKKEVIVIQKLNDLSFIENKKDIINNISNHKNEKLENIIDNKFDSIKISIDKKMNDLNNNYDFKKSNNKNIYILLNSYYKDVDLNFIKDNSDSNNNNCKNFLHKNDFQYASKKYNTDNIQNNISYSYYYTPNYINEMTTNPNIFPYNYNNQIQSYNFPENAFTINNQTNYFFTNYHNNYNFNFKNRSNKKPKENIEPKLFLIDLENIIKGIDKRTTIMIRHIPNKYSCQNILDEINIVCKDKYDFFYLPLDFENNCNLGYAFINFIDPLHIIFFYNIFKSRKWLHYNSYKECDLTFAKYQGKHELTSNIEKNLGKSDDKRRKPIIFEIKNPSKIELFKKYYDLIKEYRPELLNEINWI